MQTKEKHARALYTLSGKVETGKRLGREMGFPTANQKLHCGADIPFGIYASEVEIDGKCYEAVSNVGTRPTVSGDVPNCESHILGYSGDLYGCEIKTSLLCFLREEREFDSVEELRRQIARDADGAREFFRQYKKTENKEQ